MEAYTFKCDDGYKYKCLPGSCLICKNCSDVLWDYTHGPYCVICALDKFNERSGTECKYFKLDDQFEAWEETHESD